MSIIKPGIIFGNLVTVAAGFFLASKGVINYKLLLITLIGISLIIASGCVFNNYIDRDIDKIMERTKNRVLVTKLMSEKIAIFYAIALGILGSIVLFKTNLLTVIIALFGLFFYVVVYSLWLKRVSVYGIIIGSIAGAIPPVVGYCAVANRIDLGAVILFFILCIWQMPHSYAISIYRLDDYLKASIPVLPAKTSIYFTKLNMLIWIVTFTIAMSMLTLFGYTGYIYFTVIAFLSIFWIRISIMGFKANNSNLWAKKMFFYSIMVIVVWSIMIYIDVRN
ncbi:MAG TPA: heme o synthase [Burkholderiales bacterium]|nr:heme o synthase [Burkholderiales bacterium]